MGFLTRDRIRCSAALLVSAAVMATSLMAGHVDKARAEMTPNFLEITLRPGESVHESKTVTVPQIIPKADILFSLDLTGSMGGVLNTAKAEAINIMNQLDSLITDAHYGVVSHMDYPGTFDSFGYRGTYGSAPCGDYAYQLNQAVTGDRTAVSNAINALSLACGADGPESYERVVYESYSDPAIAWRTGARRILIMFGDNIPHDNDLNEGVPGKSGVLTTGGDPGRDEVMFTGDDIDLQSALAGMEANDVILFPVWTNGFNLVYWEHWASLTGGDALLLSSAADLPAAIESLIESSAAKVDDLHLEVSPGFESWVAFAPPGYTNLTTPATVTFEVDITVPIDTPPGDYTFTITAIGDGADYGQQTVLVHVLPLDEEPPVTTHAFTGLMGDDGWFRSDVETSLYATDDISGVAATYYTADSTATQTYTAPFMIAGDGTHDMTYHSVDNAGNVESPGKSAGLMIDATAPSTSLSVTGTMGDNGWMIIPATVEVSAADVTSGVRNSFLDLGSGYAVYSGAVTVSGEGMHNASAYTRDIAGNESAAVSESFQIDLTPPVITTGPLDAAYTEGDMVAISFSTTDAVSGLASVSATWNGAPVSDGDSVAILAGDNTLVVTATDMAGHETTVTVTTRGDVPGSVHAHPRTLNRSSDGEAFTIHINLPEPYSPADIDCLSILVDGVVAADCTHPGDGDENGHGHGRLFMFDRAQIIAIAPLGDWTLAVTGMVDGKPFMGTDTIRVIERGK